MIDLGKVENKDCFIAINNKKAIQYESTEYLERKGKRGMENEG